MLRFVFVFGLILFLFVFGSLPCFAVSDEDALLAISGAEKQVDACYVAVADEQAAGANVSALLSVLNEAGWFLSRAKLAYSQGYFDSAVTFAGYCSSMLDGFLEQAESLRVEAERNAYYDFMVNFVGSSVGALCVVACGFAVWKFLKKRGDAEERI